MGGVGGQDSELLDLFAHQVDVVWRLDLEPSPHFAFIGGAAEEILGHPAQAFHDDVGLWFRMVHRRDLALLGIGTDAAVPFGEVGGARVRFFRPDGELRWAEVRFRRVSRPEGTSLYGVTRDATERIEDELRARRSESRLAEAETLAGVGSFDWDLRRGHMWFSDNLYRLLGQDPETWHPSFEAFRAMLRPDQQPMADELIARAAELGQGFVDDVRVIRPDGSERDLDIIGLIELDDEGVLGRVHGVMRDVTEEREVEAAQRLFIADAAHELRTPVAALIGAVGLVRHRFDELDPADRAAALDLLERQSHRLRDLSTSLLDLSALEHRVAPIELTRVPVDAVVADAVAGTAPPDHLAVRHPSTGLAVSGDRWRLERVLVNLLANAYRYAASEVGVEVRRRTDTVEIVVTDDGPGVPPDAVPHLFRAFHRGAGEQGLGSGLGLTIVRRLVNSMGGWIDYREAPGGGAGFVLHLRCWDPDPG